MNDEKKPELHMSRVFTAPRRRVFAAWSSGASVSRWFAPAPLTVPRCTLDPRPGGVFSLVMRMPDGTEHPMDGHFLEVVPDERIVFVAAIHEDVTAHTTLTFTEAPGATGAAEATKLDVHQVYSRDCRPIRGAQAGWTQTLHQLATELAGDG